MFLLSFILQGFEPGDWNAIQLLLHSSAHNFHRFSTMEEANVQGQEGQQNTGINNNGADEEIFSHEEIVRRKIEGDDPDLTVLKIGGPEWDISYQSNDGEDSIGKNTQLKNMDFMTIMGLQETA